MDKRRRTSGKSGTREDRRVARSRKALSDAFVSLLLEKGYARVSIQDIVDRANVGRSTFYEHFENKEQLMLWGHDHLRELLLGDAGVSPAPDGLPRLRFRGLFEHLAESRELATALGRGPAGEIISGFLRDSLRRNLEIQCGAGRKSDAAARAVLSLRCEAAAAGLVAALWRWVKDGMGPNPKAMGEFCDEYLLRVFAA